MTGVTHHEAAQRVELDDAAAAIASARRAAAADRYTVEWRPLTELGDIAEPWRALAGCALDANVFYEPAFARAAAPVFGRGAGAILVWSADARRLVGFFPGRIERRRYGLTLPVLTGWTHAYGPLGTPLVARDAAEPVIAAWLAHLAADTECPGLVLLPFLPEHGAFAAALGAVLRRGRMPVAAFNGHRRALLAPLRERAHYVDEALDAHQRKELRRAGRRLEEAGGVTFTTATEPAAVATALDDFLTIEAGGWKGKAGTAAACESDVARFFTAAVVDLASEAKASIKRLVVDGRPVAAGIVLRSAGAAWFWKTAYDERFARFSPGVLLTAALTADLAEDRTIAQTDSCAVPEHALINRMWRERLALCDLLVAVRPQAPFRLARRLEAIRGTAIAAAKRVRARLRSTKR